MRKMKKMLVGVVLLVLLMSFSISVPAFAAENITIHASTPSDWTDSGLWAWSAPDGTNAFAAWPGEKLIKDEVNEGWYYYSVPSWINSLIINSTVGQTVDVSVESKELWISVTEVNADGKYEATVVYEAPEGFQADVAATEADVATDVPKTGDVTISFLWISLAVLSGVGYILIRRRKIVL